MAKHCCQSQKGRKSFEPMSAYNAIVSEYAFMLSNNCPGNKYKDGEK